MSDGDFLRIQGLHKQYGDFVALHPVDLTVARGEFLTIVGPSGSGKTTLIKLLVGMEEQSGGEIWLDGQRIDALPAHQRPTCMVFQSLALFPHRSVGQNIEFPLKIRGVEAAQRRVRACELLSQFHLPLEYYDKRIDACSGGEKQRIALARALAFDPDILFFDEPLSALDFRLRKTLEKELKNLHATTGKTFVYITHSLEEAMVMSDRIAILRNGRFEQIGAAEAIYSRPQSRFVAGFMGEVNLFEVASDDHGMLTLETGAVLTPLAADTLALARRTPCWIMVRPEYLRPLAEHETADLTVDGRVQASYMMGSRTQYDLLMPSGRQLIAELGNDMPLDCSGAPVRFGCTSRHCHVISESGQ